VLFRKQILNQSLLVELHVVGTLLVVVLVVVVIVVVIVVLQMLCNMFVFLLFALTETTPAGNFILNYIFLRTRDNEATELILQKYKLNNMLAASVKIVSAFFHDICL